MAKRKVYDLAKVIAAEIEKARPMVIKVGEVSIEVPPPVLWPDSSQSAENDVELAKLVLGEDDYALFTEAGGTAALLFQLVAEHQGASLGESEASTGS